MSVIAPSAQTVQGRLRDAIAAKQAMLDGPCVGQAVEVANRMVEAFRGGHKVIFFGNGGSSMDAGHLAGELVGRFAFDRPSLAAVSLPDATASMTAIGNDYGYDDVFARSVLGIGVAGDVVVGLSTSGNSANVVCALAAAREAGMVTVVLTGARESRAGEAAEICIRVPTDDTPRVQEACLHLGHTICEMVEAAMFARLA